MSTPQPPTDKVTGVQINSDPVTPPKVPTNQAATTSASTLNQQRWSLKIGRYWKAIVAACGVALMIWNEIQPGLAYILPASWSHWITIVVGVVTVIGTWGVPNRTAAAQPT